MFIKCLILLNFFLILTESSFIVLRDQLTRLKRQQNSQQTPNSNFNFETQRGLTVPQFQKTLGGDFLGDKVGTNVDLTNPSVSAGRGFDAFNLFNSEQGINRVGDRGNGNFGGGVGRSVGILGNRFGASDNSDVNFNRNDGFQATRQRGLTGIFTETRNVNSNPLVGNFFGQNQQTCIGEAFIKGLCFQKNTGIGK